MEKIALIYIGGNTTRFALWQINEDRSYILLQSYKETLKLGQTTRESSRITEEKADELMVVLQNFKGVADSLGADTTTLIFSEFFRRISNKVLIQDRIEKELSLKAMELSSNEEMELDYLAIVHSMRIRNTLIVDISGGSTQVAWVKEGVLFKMDSLPLGTLTLTEKFQLEEMVTKDTHVALENCLNKEIGNIAWLKEGNFDEMVIVGGSARAISKIDRNKRRYPMRIIHEYEMQDIDVINMYNIFMTKSLRQRYLIEGLDKDRADIILGALGILSMILKTTKLKNIRVSGAGIREGFLFRYLTQKQGEMADMLDRSISNILSIHTVDKTHAESLYRLTSSIYSAFCTLHKDWGDLSQIIKVSSKLRDVGLSVRYYNHEKHNFYIISNSEINGLNHRGIIMSALASTFTDGLTHERSILEYGQIINRMDLSMVNDIGICISMAEKLLRAEIKVVTFKRCHITEDAVQIVFTSKDPMHFEQHEVMKLSDIFLDMYGKTLMVEIEELKQPESGNASK